MHLDALSIPARQMLAHLDAAGLGPGSFELASQFDTIFTSPAECAAAQTELAAAGLAELGPVSHVPGMAEIRSIALTLDGFRLLRQD